jgi:hypothetical protein
MDGKHAEVDAVFKSLRDALFQEGQCAEESDCTGMPWCRIRNECQRAALAQEEQEPVGNPKKFFDEVLYTGALPQSQQDQSDINWLKARPCIEQFIAGVGYDMTLTHENVFFKSREKVDVLTQPEPVAWRFHDGKMWCYVNHLTDLPTPKFEPLYIHPPSREWQGLTHPEQDPAMKIAKLKELGEKVHRLIRRAQGGK